MMRRRSGHKGEGLLGRERRMRERREGMEVEGVVEVVVTEV